MQIKNLINIVNHDYEVIIEGNTFVGNSVIKGVVYVQLSDSGSATALIKNNTFDQNFAYYGASAVFMRKNTSNLE